MGNTVRKYGIHITNKKQNVTYNVRGSTNPLKFVGPRNFGTVGSLKLP